MYKIFIDGGHGTTGLEIRERLLRRDDIQILDIEDKFRKDLAARAERAAEADVTIMCLPDEASRELVKVLPPDVRVIDTSTAHRTDPDWVYGMAELTSTQRGAIRNAARVANPGCHATGFIFLARPLVDAGLISSKSSLSCFCITGYSGGGRKMIEDYEKRHAEALSRAEASATEHGASAEAAVTENSSACAVSPAQYALSQSHKHLPEMKMMSRIEKEPVFCPVVGDFYRGMVMTVELPAEMISRREDTLDTIEVIKDAYRMRYNDEPLIRLEDGPEDGFLYSDTMAMSDGLEIVVLGNSDRVLLVSRFDNLGKGASGAAVQNLNIMLGTDELKGLRF